MDVTYSINILKEEKNRLKGLIESIENGTYVKNNIHENERKLKTKFKHQLNDVETSIEILEDHVMSYDEE